MKMTKSLLLAGILGSSFLMSGCVAAALGAAYVVGEEVNENDGDFDPLDEIVDGSDTPHLRRKVRRDDGTARTQTPGRFAFHGPLLIEQGRVFRVASVRLTQTGKDAP